MRTLPRSAAVDAGDDAAGEGTMDRRRLMQGAVAGAVVAACPGAGRAQDYPSRLIRYVVGFPPGGSADVTMRLFAARMTPELGGANHVIENVPGASSTLGAGQVARAEPDGHTLYLGSDISQAIAPAMLRMPYDPLTALAPISLLTVSPSIVAVGAGYGVRTWAEFVAKARGEREGVLYGTSNVGFQIPAVQISKATGIRLVNVPFKGGGETVTALISGNIPMVIGTPASILPHVASGAAVPLVLTSARRSPAMPDIPGTSEVGLDGIDILQWFGLFAPAKTPEPIVTRLHAAIQAALADPQLRAALAREGAEARGSTSPEAFATFQREAAQAAATVIREAGLAPGR